MYDNNKHSKHTKPVAPIVYAVSTAYDDKTKGMALKRGTVRREVMGDHITYIIKNRMGVEMIVDADSIDNLIAALQQARKQDQF